MPSCTLAATVDACIPKMEVQPMVMTKNANCSLRAGNADKNHDAIFVDCGEKHSTEKRGKPEPK